MSARTTPYPTPSHRVRIPSRIWAVGVETIRDYGASNSEGLVYFAGVVASPQDIIVTAVYRIGHRPQGDSVVVTPAEGRWLVRTLRARDEKLVAQLHSRNSAEGPPIQRIARCWSFATTASSSYRLTKSAGASRLSTASLTALLSQEVIFHGGKDSSRD